MDLHWTHEDKQSNTDPKEDIGNQREASTSDNYATEGVPKGNAKNRLYATEVTPKEEAKTREIGSETND